MTENWQCPLDLVQYLLEHISVQALFKVGLMGVQEASSPKLIELYREVAASSTSNTYGHAAIPNCFTVIKDLWEFQNISPNALSTSCDQDSRMGLATFSIL